MKTAQETTTHDMTIETANTFVLLGGIASICGRVDIANSTPEDKKHWSLWRNCLMHGQIAVIQGGVLLQGTLKRDGPEIFAFVNNPALYGLYTRGLRCLTEGAGKSLRRGYYLQPPPEYVERPHVFLIIDGDLMSFDYWERWAERNTFSWDSIERNISNAVAEGNRNT